MMNPTFSRNRSITPRCPFSIMQEYLNRMTFICIGASQSMLCVCANRVQDGIATAPLPYLGNNGFFSFSLGGVIAVKAISEPVVAPISIEDHGRKCVSFSERFQKLVNIPFIERHARLGS